jgi:hypothetical protein
MDMHARRARDKLVPLDILLRVRGRIVDNPARDTQAGVWAMEENRGHLNSVGPPARALIDIDQAALLQAQPSYKFLP